MSGEQSLAFEQREGVEPLPRQLALREISQELRALLWRMFDGWIQPQYSSAGFAEPWLDDRWEQIFKDMWFARDHEVGSFENSYKLHIGRLRRVLAKGSYAELLGLLEWLMRHPLRLSQFNRNIQYALETTRAAYRVVDDTIVPVVDEHQSRALDLAFEDVGRAGMDAARQILRKAAGYATTGQWADSIRESIHAVESVARSLAPDSNELGVALVALEQAGHLHPAMKRAFGALYGFTSDEKGIRHSPHRRGLSQNRRDGRTVYAWSMRGVCKLSGRQR